MTIDPPLVVIHLLVLVLVVALAVAIHAYVQRRFGSAELRRHNDVAGYLFSVVGVLYAVVLGFVVVVVWQKYDGTVANVEDEVAAASDLYRIVGGLPGELRSPIRKDLRAYADGMIRTEWPAMQRHSPVPTENAQLLEDVAYRIAGFAPRTSGETDAQQAATTQIDRLLDARRLRLVHTAPLVPVVLWSTLLAGAGALLVFALFFGVENQPAQLVMTAMLVGLIALLFFVILEFASPFSGSVRISDDGWIYLEQRLPYIR